MEDEELLLSHSKEPRYVRRQKYFCTAYYLRWVFMRSAFPHTGSTQVLISELVLNSSSS
jgi:hypothetical protein